MARRPGRAGSVPAAVLRSGLAPRAGLGSVGAAAAGLVMTIVVTLSAFGPRPSTRSAPRGAHLGRRGGTGSGGRSVPICGRVPAPRLLVPLAAGIPLGNRVHSGERTAVHGEPGGTEGLPFVGVGMLPAIG